MIMSVHVFHLQTCWMDFDVKRLGYKTADKMAEVNKKELSKEQ